MSAFFIILALCLTALMWIIMGLSSGVEFFNGDGIIGAILFMVVWPMFVIVGPFGYIAVWRKS